MSTALIVLCEGPTERNFVVKTLVPHLRKFHIYTKPQSLDGTPTLPMLHKEINNALQTRRNHEYVTTMLDLYRLGKLPGNHKISGENVRERVARIEKSLLEEFPNPHFIPYIELHEFEALVLVDVSLVRTAFPDGEADRAIAGLQREINGVEPELINDGQDTAPSKRLISAIPEYKIVKSSAGPEIVDAIGLDRLRKKCPNFDSWVTRLESLGGSK